MSRQRYKWWGYVKAMIRQYEPGKMGGLTGVAERERAAVADAVEETMTLVDGVERMKLVNLVFWRQSHSLDGAALALYVSDRTAQEWHRQFIRLVAKNFGLLD